MARDIRAEDIIRVLRSIVSPHNINPKGDEQKALDIEDAAREILDFTPEYPPNVGPQEEGPRSMRFSPGLLTRLASMTPAGQSPLQMWMRLYEDESDPRQMIGPNEGTPGTANVNPVANALHDMVKDTADEDAIRRTVTQEKQLRREMDENRFTPQLRRLQKLNPDMWRYLDQLPSRNAPEEYLDEDDPEPIASNEDRDE